MRKIDRTNKRYGRLVAIREVEPYIQENGRKRNRWECQCDCGNIVNIRADSMGRTESCGCIQKEMIASVNYKHGQAKNSSEYKTWSKIKSRCNCKTDKKYPIYGGRGIKMCKEWEDDFLVFLSDMGERPEGCNSIDRIDVNKGYNKKNCRWSYPKQQANNTRSNVYIVVDGVTKTLKQWAEHYGVNYKALHRLHRSERKSFMESIEYLKNKKDGRF